MRSTPGEGSDSFLRASEGYAAASEGLLTRLIRHLDNEEDLITPLILDRGEGGLGMG